MSAPVLSVRDLSVTLCAGPETRTVVDGISFDLFAGEILGLVGESGCGKSKTAEAVMGLLPQGLGAVRARRLRLGQSDLLTLPERELRQIRGRRMSMVFQEPLTALDPVFDVGGQLATVIRRHRCLSRKQAREAAVEMLVRMGFADPEFILHRYPHQLSGGMRQRIIVAMAMACHPQLLIADEPTTALDVTTQAQVLTQLTSLAAESGTATLLITHDLGIVAQYCQRALVMQHGRIVEDATVAALFAAPQHPYTAALLAAARGQAA